MSFPCVPIYFTINVIDYIGEPNTKYTVNDSVC